MSEKDQINQRENTTKGIHTEWKVLAVVISFVLILEVVSRIIAPGFDSASEYIFEFPEIVESIGAEPKEKCSVMLFGNSLIKRGVNIDQLQEALPANNNIAVAKVAPVGTTIVDWTYLYKRYFENENTHPDIVFVGFVRHHIADAADAYPIRNRRLGRHFLAQEDQAHLWEHELPDFHDKIQTSLSHYSSLLGDQPEHQYLLFRVMIPHYGEGLSLNNDWVDEWKRKRTKKLAELSDKQLPPVTYKRLERFLDLMNSHGVKVCMIPMPQPEVYEIDNDVISLLESKGGTWLDARKVCLGQEYFSDGYHLGEKGIPIFTEWLSKEIEKYSK